MVFQLSVCISETNKYTPININAIKGAFKMVIILNYSGIEDRIFGYHTEYATMCITNYGYINR